MSLQRSFDEQNYPFLTKQQKALIEAVYKRHKTRVAVASVIADKAISRSCLADTAISSGITVSNSSTEEVFSIEEQLKDLKLR